MHPLEKLADDWCEAAERVEYDQQVAYRGCAGDLLDTLTSLWHPFDPEDLNTWPRVFDGVSHWYQVETTEGQVGVGYWILHSRAWHVELNEDLENDSEGTRRDVKAYTELLPGPPVLEKKNRTPDATSDTYAIEEELKHGGAWLGAAREWLTWNVSDRIKWASAERVTIAFNRFEEFASRVAVAAVSKERQGRARESVQLREVWEGQRAIKRLKGEHEKQLDRMENLRLDQLDAKGKALEIVRGKLHKALAENKRLREELRKATETFAKLCNDVSGSSASALEERARLVDGWNTERSLHDATRVRLKAAEERIDELEALGVEKANG